MTFLQEGKTFNKIFSKYLNYTNVFLVNLTIKLLKYNNIKDHVIEMVKGKQLLYGSIYSLNSIKLEILKTYIEIYLKTRLFQSLNSFTGVFVFLIKNLMATSFYILII